MRSTDVSWLSTSEAVAVFCGQFVVRVPMRNRLSVYLTYDALDRLLTVTSSLNGTMTSSYGFDGQRELTQAPDGTITRWFSAAMTEQNGTHDHFVSVGETVVARVRFTPGILREGALAATPVLGALALIRPFRRAYRRRRPQPSSLAGDKYKESQDPFYRWR
jgi:hypothetical protein